MHLHIFFTPAELAPVEADPNDIYIVIDVMRATTTLAVMFDQGANRVLAALTLEQALEAAQQGDERLLCGERQTKVPPGFHYGNSPALFSQMDLTGRDLILTTSNGTRALFACPEASTRLTGSFYNAHAVKNAAFALAQERGSNIVLVCAAEYGYFALEDAACAGYFALELLLQHPELMVHDSTHGAIALYEAYPPAKLLEYAQSARDLMAVGQQKDLEFCVKKNASKSVPMVIGKEETGLLVIERSNSLKL